MIHYFSGNDYSTDFAMHARLFSYWYISRRDPTTFGRPEFRPGMDMKTYMAGYLSFLGAENQEDTIVTRQAAPSGILETFFYITPRAQAEVDAAKPWATFLDSGGFSAFTQNKTVDIEAYIAYVQAHSAAWDIIASLDVIGDAVKSWAKFEYMRRKLPGVTIMPCFHYGEPWPFLDRMVAECDYIAIGGVAQLGGGSALLDWLDAVWSNHLVRPDGTPKVKVHGFAITGKQAMLRYPWESVDSSSWLQMAGRGVIALDLPGVGDGWTDLKISFSERSPAQERLDKHYDSLAPAYQAAVRQYLEGMGYEIENLRKYYRWRQHCNIGYYKRMEKRCVQTFVREQPGLFF